MPLKIIGSYNFENHKSTIPRIKASVATKAGNRATNFFKDNFDRQGFLDRNVQRWRPTRKKRGKTLVETGSLRRSIQPTLVSFKRTRIETVGIRYARIHNEGGRAGRGGSAEIPQRKFMGNSAKLTKEISDIFLKGFLKAI